MDSGGPFIPKLCSHENCDNCWSNYPQSRYPNWTAAQVKKSKIAEAIRRQQHDPCVSYYVDVDDRGHFMNVENFEAGPGEVENTWKSLLAIRVSLFLYA